MKGIGSAFSHRAVTLSALVVGFIAAGVGTASAALAVDPGTATLFSGATDIITTILIPAVVAIVLVGSLFWLGVRWYQKGKNAGNK